MTKWYFQNAKCCKYYNPTEEKKYWNYICKGIIKMCCWVKKRKVRIGLTQQYRQVQHLQRKNLHRRGRCLHRPEALRLVQCPGVSGLYDRRGDSRIARRQRPHPTNAPGRIRKTDFILPGRSWTAPTMYAVIVSWRKPIPIKRKKRAYYQNDNDDSTPVNRLSFVWFSRTLLLWDFLIHVSSYC